MRRPDKMAASILVPVLLVVGFHQAGSNDVEAPAATRSRRDTRVEVAPQDTARAPEPCPKITPALVDAGREVFEKGTCQACHGPEGAGTPLGPDLTDESWLQADGSYVSIANVVRNGVPEPAEFPAPMPMKGGTDLEEDELCAVAAYVVSLSRP